MENIKEYKRCIKTIHRCRISFSIDSDSDLDEHNILDRLCNIAYNVDTEVHIPEAISGGLTYNHNSHIVIESNNPYMLTKVADYIEFYIITNDGISLMPN